MNDTAHPAFDLPKPELGRWREGNTGTEGVWRFEAAAPGREVLVTALVHGNELCGAWALLAALQTGLRPRRGALTLAFCNLAAFDRFDREQFTKSRCVDEDLNRLWGEMPWRDAPASVEKRRVLELLPFVERADWLLDLHSMIDEAPPLALTGLAPRHVELTRAIGAPPLVVLDAGHAAGRRLRDHGRWGVESGDDGSRALLVECGFHGAPSSREVALDALGRFLVAAGSVDELEVPGGWWRPTMPSQQVLRVTEAVTAKPGESARWAARWRTGQCVPKAGTVLGWNAGEPFSTPYDDCVLIMPFVGEPKPGTTLVRLAREVEA